MKRKVLLTLAALVTTASLLSGCVVYEPGHHHRHYWHYY